LEFKGSATLRDVRALALNEAVEYPFKDASGEDHDGFLILTRRRRREFPQVPGKDLAVACKIGWDEVKLRVFHMDALIADRLQGICHRTTVAELGSNRLARFSPQTLRADRTNRRERERSHACQPVGR